jgi:putative DNA primase/helicase
MKNDSTYLQTATELANPDHTAPFVPKTKAELLGEITPYYDHIHGDLVYYGVKHDADHGLTHTAPVRLCRSFDLIGRGVDCYGDHYRLVRWRDAVTDAEQTAALPSSGIGEREGWALLNAKGLAVASNRGARERLADYLHIEGEQTRYVIAQQSGWQQGAFVLPTGEVIGTPDTQLFYPGAVTHRPAFTPKGTSQSWRDTVGALVKDNPLAMTAVACSLAGAVLELIEARDGIGLHLHTESSSGKSTCADVAASLWGNPAKLMQSWDGTGIGLTNSAEFANGMMLYLDEIGAGDARKMGSIIYTMLNGVSRTQGRKEGGNRAKRTWLMTLISTGEIPMSQFLTDGGHALRGGQEIRMLDIPADVGKFRAFDCIHGRADGGAFSIELTAAARANYGCIGREFVAWLIANKASVKDWVGSSENRILAQLDPGAAPTVRRATRKFAILAAALEMAADAGLTGWTREESFQAVCTTWQRWLSVFGLASRDDERLIEQANAALASHQFSRFVLLPQTDKEPIVPNMLGYKRVDANGDTIFFVLSHAFKDEIAKGYEPKKACKVLHDAGMLGKPPGHDGWTVVIGRGLGRGYKMTLRPCSADEAEE